MDRHFTQRKLGVKLTFDFTADRLSYGMRDYSGERQFSVPYETINVLEPGALTVNALNFYRAAIFVPLLLVGLSMALGQINAGVAGILGPLATGLLVLLLVLRNTNLLAVKYTLLKMSPMPPGAGSPSLKIIDDRHHAAILDELKTRWRSRLRQLHGAINFANSVEKEIAKFGWMKERAIISDQEYREAVEKLRSYQATLGQQPETRTLN